MHDFAALEVVGSFEMRYLERANGLNCGRERLIRILLAPGSSKLFASGSQDTQDLCPVESLSLAMITERHIVVSLHASRLL